jgi:RNA polymerase sigma-70 factor (ECF subfamily)
MAEIQSQHSSPASVQTDMAASVALPASTFAPALSDRDAELMLRVRDGDTQAFALLLDRHRRPVLAYLYRMTQNQAVAEELGQEVFLRVFRSRQSYEVTAKFTTWLFRIATHLALNWVRDSRGERTHESLDDTTADGPAREVRDSQLTVEQQLLAGVKVQEIRRAIEALPPKQRAAVLMHKYQELDYQQIARALECSESALKSILFRAYQTLRARLAHLNV